MHSDQTLLVAYIKCNNRRYMNKIKLLIFLNITVPQGNDYNTYDDLIIAINRSSRHIWCVH